jgi:hypothetical protein
VLAPFVEGEPLPASLVIEASSPVRQKKSTRSRPFLTAFLLSLERVAKNYPSAFIDPARRFEPVHPR